MVPRVNSALEWCAVVAIGINKATSNAARIDGFERPDGPKYLGAVFVTKLFTLLPATGGISLDLISRSAKVGSPHIRVDGVQRLARGHE